MGRDDEILARLQQTLSVEDWARLRRGLALLDGGDDDCPPTQRNPRAALVEPASIERSGQ
jgi:hypothetical protein